MSAADEERLRLVTDLSELRVGMKVLDLACDRCGRECRAFLTGVRSQAWAVDHGFVGTVFTADPCLPQRPGEFYGFDEQIVAARRLYRILDDLEDPAAYERDLRLDEESARITKTVRDAFRRARAAAEGNISAGYTWPGDET